MSTIQNSRTQAITLDSIYEKIKYWRDHKDKFPDRAIPDEIWSMIFSFQKQKNCSTSEMKRLFSLSSQQYNKKYTQLVEPDKNTTKLTAPIVPTEFSKVEVRESSSSVVPSLTEKALATSNDVAYPSDEQDILKKIEK